MPVYEEGMWAYLPIIVNLDVVMAKRKISAGDLAAKVGITPANLSILKNNKAKAVRLSTLDAICKALDCQPGDILQYVEDEKDGQESGGRPWMGNSVTAADITE